MIEAILPNRFNEFAIVFPISSIIFKGVGVPKSLVVHVQIAIERIDDETQCFG